MPRNRRSPQPAGQPCLPHRRHLGVHRWPAAADQWTHLALRPVFSPRNQPAGHPPSSRSRLGPLFERYLRNPRYSFDQLPFPDTRITHVYANPADGLTNYIEVFPGVRIARTSQELVESVDAVWLGDASGRGNDHFELVAPGPAARPAHFLRQADRRHRGRDARILDLAREHRAPLMSSSIFRHEFGMEHALRMKDSGEFGALHFVLASMYGGYSPDAWFIYGQHPVWTVMTLCGPGAQAVSMYARNATAHALITYADRMPAEVWYGRPDLCESVLSDRPSILNAACTSSRRPSKAIFLSAIITRCSAWPIPSAR